MLPEQRGLLASWFSRFRSSKRGSAGRKSATARQFGYARQAHLEPLEDRRMLATLYVDFGDLFGTTTATDATWANYGLAVPNGQTSWIAGPQFLLPGNTPVTYTPFPTLMGQGANQALVNAFDPGPDGNDDPFQYSAGALPPIDKIAAMETSIVEMLTREFAPFNVDVLQETSRNMGEIRADLAGNNRVDNPYLVTPNAIAMMPDPNFYNSTTANPAGHVPPGYLGAMNAAMQSIQTADVYIMIGGWTSPGNPPQVGVKTGTNFGFSDDRQFEAGGLVNGFPSYSDPNDPVFGGGGMGPAIPVTYADMGGAVAADTIAQQALTLVDPVTGDAALRFNTAVAVVAAQMAGIAYSGTYPLIDPTTMMPVLDPVTGLPITESMEHSSSGEPSIGNPFFDTNVDVLTGSDIMREGPQELMQPFPSLNNVAVFTRFPLTVGDANPDPTVVQNSFDYLNNLTDWVGPNTTIAIGDPTTPTLDVFPPIGYVTGTGASDHITLVNDPNNAGMILVTIDAYRDPVADSVTGIIPAAMTPDLLIQSFSYDLDPTAFQTLIVEAGNGNDQIDIDPSIPFAPGTSLEIFGGGGTNNFSMLDGGTDDVSITATNLDTFAFSGVERFDTKIVLNPTTTPTTFNLEEFQDNSDIHLEGFKSLTYTMPEFLGANFSVTGQSDLINPNVASGFTGSLLAIPPTDSNVDMVIDGTAGPTQLSPVIGVANIEFTNIPTVTIQCPVGGTSDSLTVDSDFGFADGLQNFTAALGPGDDVLNVLGTNFALPVAGGFFTFDAGTGNDTVNATGDTNWTLVDGDNTTSPATPGQLMVDGGVGGSVQLVNMVGKTVNISGGDSDNTIEVDSWSGTATLDGGFGNDMFIIGTATSAVTGTLNITGDDGADTFEINNWIAPIVPILGVTGGGTVDGGNDGDTFDINALLAPGVTFTGGGGNDIFNIGADGDTSTVTSDPTLIGGDGLDTVNMDDTNSSVSNTTEVDYSLSDSGVFGGVPGFGGVSFDNTMDKVIVTGTNGPNNFSITPSQKTTFMVNGLNPPLGTPIPNDSLSIAFDGTKGANLSGALAPPGPGNGSWQFSDGHKPIIFTGIETNQNLAVPLLADSTAAGAGSKPLVKVYDASSNALVMSFYAYETTFNGGVHVTVADVTGDGIDDIITAPGAGRVGEVKVFDGAKMIAAASPTGTHLVSNPDQFLVDGNDFSLITTKGSTAATVAAGFDINQLVIGQSVVGADIPAYTTITAINKTTGVVTLSAAATASSTVVGDAISLTTTKNSKIAKVASTVGLVKGQIIVGPDVPANTTITAINTTAKTITLSLAATVTGTTSSVVGSFIAVTTTAGSNLVTVNDSTGLLDKSISGPTIPVGTTVMQIIDGTTIQLSANASGSNSNNVTIAGVVPEAATYKSGLYVASGDLDGDGNKNDFVTSTASGLGHVSEFLGPSLTPGLSFNAYTTANKVTKGAVVAVGDVNGDGVDEIVTAPGAGVAAQIKIFDGVSGTLLRSFTAFAPTFKNGVSLALGDVDNTDGLNTDEIIVGAGASNSSQVAIYDSFGTPKNVFKAYTTGTTQAPVQVAVRNIGGIEEIFTSQTNNGSSRQIRAFEFDPVKLTDAQVDAFLETDPSFVGGIFLG